MGSCSIVEWTACLSASNALNQSSADRCDKCTTVGRCNAGALVGDGGGSKSAANATPAKVASAASYSRAGSVESFDSQVVQSPISHRANNTVLRQYE